ncbi:MAG TPA: hypothetical protein VMF89_31330 [Polyangiales bacterium]|nr:hypothetical protein [Polyangiales bacterium]
MHSSQHEQADDASAKDSIWPHMRSFVASGIASYALCAAIYAGAASYRDVSYWAALAAAPDTAEALRLEGRRELESSALSIDRSMAELARTERAQLASIKPRARPAPPLLGWVHTADLARRRAVDAWRAANDHVADSERETP